MALGPLTLDVTYGVAGRAFQATISGAQPGSTIEVANPHSTGFYVANGRLYNDSLPGRARITPILRETLAGTGTRDSRIDIAVDGIEIGAAGIPSALAGVGVQSNIINPLPTSLRKWARARARVRAGIGRGRILCIGTSKTAGAGAGTGGNSTDGASPAAWPDRLATILAGLGLPANRQTYCGTKGFSNANFALYDTRWTIPGEWVGQVSPGTLGGTMMQGGANTHVQFTPVGQIDTAFVVGAYTGGGGTSTMNVAFDAATTAVATNVTNTGTLIASCTAAVALGNHAIDVWRNGGGTAVNLSTIIAYNSAVPAVDILNAGYFGSRADQIVGGPLTADQFIATVAPDLTFIGYGTNEILQGASLDTMRTAIQTLITAAKAAGSDVALIVETNTAISQNQTTLVTQAVLDAKRQVILDLGAANNCPVLDFSGRFGAYVDANALGYFNDQIHEKAIGYADQAQLVSQFLML